MTSQITICFDHSHCGNMSTSHPFMMLARFLYSWLSRCQEFCHLCTHTFCGYHTYIIYYYDTLFSINARNSFVAIQNLTTLLSFDAYSWFDGHSKSTKMTKLHARWNDANTFIHVVVTILFKLQQGQLRRSCEHILNHVFLWPEFSKPTKKFT